MSDQPCCSDCDPFQNGARDIFTPASKHDCSCHHKPQPKVCGEPRPYSIIRNGVETNYSTCQNQEPCPIHQPDHEARGMAQVVDWPEGMAATPKLVSEAKPPVWEDFWKETKYALLFLAGADASGEKSLGYKERERYEKTFSRIKTIAQQLLSSSDKAARVEELEWVLKSTDSLRCEHSVSDRAECFPCNDSAIIRDRLAALKVDLKEGRT